MKYGDKTAYRKLIRKFKNKKILVIGDLMIDQYMWGDVTRISPEAPIPVVEVNREESKPGGAANVILNLISMGAKVYCAGVVGKDTNAHMLVKYFKKYRINADAVIEDSRRPTTIKTRVFAHHQQVVRIDKEKIIPVNKKTIQMMLSRIKNIISKVDAVIFSDYNKGMITKELVSGVAKMAGNKIVTVDPKPKNIRIFKNVTLISPNKNEASKATGVAIENTRDLLKAGRELKKITGSKAVLITRGEEGMTLLGPKGVHHIPTVAREVYDVTGAGDTVISVATLALCCGADFSTASKLANIAAGVSVAEVGVVAVKPSELSGALDEAKC